MIQYLHPGTRTPSIFPEAPTIYSSVKAPTTRSNDDVARSFGPEIVNRYFVWPGHTDDVRHSFFDYRIPELGEEGQETYLTPRITTYYGHDLIAPQGITLIPISDTRKTRLNLMTLHRLDGDASKELTVLVWQGDNDTLHIVNPLPTEDEYVGFNQTEVFGQKTLDDSRKDYLLARLWYGDTAVLDTDIAEIITPGRVLRA